jgi:hypothetical protein
MSEQNVTPIRPEVIVGPKRKGRGPGGGSVVSRAVMDRALNAQRSDLFQAMGIVRLASREALGIAGDDEQMSDIWTALDGAYTLMDRVSARLEDCKHLVGSDSRANRPA